MRTEEKLYTVYRLKNVVTGKNYIGMTSLEPKERWRFGYAGKMKEAIKEFPLDLCWKKSIEFQTPNKEQALELESELMKWYDSVENGYNTSEYGGFSCKHSEDTRNKMSQALRGENNPMYGMTGENSPFYGKHHSEESKEKIRKNNPSKPVLQFSKNGEFIAEYPSTQEAERQTGCNHSSICECCKGKRKSCGGFIWQYKSSY